MRSRKYRSVTKCRIAQINGAKIRFISEIIAFYLRNTMKDFLSVYPASTSSERISNRRTKE